MTWLVATVMAVTVVAAWRETRERRGWSRAGALALLYAPIAVALAVVFPAARALAAAAPAEALVAARRILAAHAGCFVSVGAFLALSIARRD
jgi:hypothetical protein